MFRAGTLSRLKRPSLFRSCRWEASPKAQGFSEDASHHARKHKTPTEGTAYGVHRSVPENQRFRHPVFFVFQLKICRPSTEKVFGSPPFSKGGAGLQGGKPCKEPGAGREALQRAGCRAGALQEALGKGESEQFFNSGHFCAETEDFRSLFQIGDGRKRRGDTQILIQGVFSIGEGITDLC